MGLAPKYSPFVRLQLLLPPRKLTPVQVLERLNNRLEKRMEALQHCQIQDSQKLVSGW